MMPKYKNWENQHKIQGSGILCKEWEWEIEEAEHWERAVRGSEKGKKGKISRGINRGSWVFSYFDFLKIIWDKYGKMLKPDKAWYG